MKEPAKHRVCVREHFERRSKRPEVNMGAGQEQSLKGQKGQCGGSWVNSA